MLCTKRNVFINFNFIPWYAKIFWYTRKILHFFDSYESLRVLTVREQNLTFLIRQRQMPTSSVLLNIIFKIKLFFWILFHLDTWFTNKDHICCPQNNKWTGRKSLFHITAVIYANKTWTTRIFLLFYILSLFMHD